MGNSRELNTGFLGSIYGKGPGFAGAVWDDKKLSPTLTTMQGGGREPMVIEQYEVVAERGRAYRGQAPQLEVNKEGIANTVTTVEKDNMVLEMGHIEKGTGDHQSNRVYSEEGCALSICAMTGVKQPPAMHVEVRQATKDGYIQCEIGGVADLNYPDSKTRRGRVQGNGQICPTLTTENIPSVIEPWTWEIDGVKYRIRIRKLTPKECWRLMDFDDEDFDKAAEVNSNTQLYKEAGNSIVVSVLENIFKQMIPEDQSNDG